MRWAKTPAGTTIYFSKSCSLCFAGSNFTPFFVIFVNQTQVVKKIQFKTNINASCEKVWEALWKDENYRAWTSIFSEGSYMKSDWKEGGQAEFHSPTGEGLFSEIARMVPHLEMSFRHIGVIRDGKRVTDDPGARVWTGALETYHLRPNGRSTELEVVMDITEDQEDYFRSSFPRALQKIKELAEV
jgi:hypothetical protein